MKVDTNDNKTGQFSQDQLGHETDQDIRQYVTFIVGDEVFAVDDTCSHSEASLSEGEVTDFKIECWLHGAEFDLRTGAALTLPANISLQTYAVKIDGNSVTVQI